MPLIPRIRPLTRMKSAEAKPSRIPPTSEAHGVKLIQSIVILIYSFGVLQNCTYSTFITASACGLSMR